MIRFAGGNPASGKLPQAEREKDAKMVNQLCKQRSLE